MREIKIETVLVVEDHHIDDLMVTALEDGINYWCGKTRITKFPENVEDDSRILASDCISQGGEVTLFDAESEDTWVLTIEKFLNGLKMYCVENCYSDMEDLMDNYDSDTADQIVQYALFNEIVFG